MRSWPGRVAHLVDPFQGTRKNQLMSEYMGGSTKSVSLSPPFSLSLKATNQYNIFFKEEAKSVHS